MSHDQRVRIAGGNRPVTTVGSSIVMSSENAPDVEWELFVLDDGTLTVTRVGRFCFDVRPKSPSNVHLIHRRQ